MSEILGVTASQGEKPCIDNECDGIAEIEQDGGYTYFECPKCWTIFEYRKIPNPVVNDSCAIGVPESVRRAASDNPMSEDEALQQRRKAFVERITMGKPDA